MVKAKLGKALAKKLSDFIDEMKDKYAMTPDQTKSAIRNYYNEGYEAGSPKRMLPGDDEPLALTVTNNTILPSTKADFMQDIFEQSVMDDVLGEARKELDLLKLKQLDPTKMTKQADGGRVGMIKGGLLKGLASLFKKKKPKKTEKFGPPRDPERDYETAAALKESRKRYDLERKNLSPLQDELDKMLIAEKKRGEDILNELKIATSEMEEKTRALEEFNRIADEDGIEAALEAFEDIINPKRTLNAAGGRVGAKVGGLMSLLRQLGMKAPDKIADKKQIENVIRDPKTDLERIYKDRPSMGTKATPKNQPTIDEIRDMIQNDPRYDKLTAAQMDEVVKRETVRADFAYNMGISPEEVDDQIVDMLMMEGYASRFGFQQGGVANPNLRSGIGTLLSEGMTPGEIEEEKKLIEAQLIDPSYNSVTGEYSVGGGLKIGPLEIEAMARGIEGSDPTMQYEGSLDLGNDLMLQGGYYDDAINTIPTGPFAGMGDVEDEMRLSLTKSFANGGTVPPQKGPMSEGMGTLYRSK
jgi:hypothetical protein